MSDIINELREAAEQFHEGSGYEVLLRVAADEIERLRAALAATEASRRMECDRADMRNREAGYANDMRELAQLELNVLKTDFGRAIELLREAGDFMTPEAHADWKKKCQAARAAGGGE